MTSRRAWARPVWAAGLVVALALTQSGCDFRKQASSGGTSPAGSTPAMPGSAAPQGVGSSASGGATAGPVSTAYRIEGRDMRLVRSGDQELALQFELFNGTSAPVDVSGLGLDPREQ